MFGRKGPPQGAPGGQGRPGSGGPRRPAGKAKGPPQAGRPGQRPAAAPAAEEPVQIERSSVRLSEVVNCLYDGKDAFFRYVHTVADVMTEAPEYLTMDDKIRDGREFIEKHGVQDVPVVDEEKNKQGAILKRHFVGMVSKRLVARMFSANVGTLAQTDRDDAFLNEGLAALIRLCRDVSTVEPSTSIHTAVEILFEQNLDSLPVVTTKANGDRSLIGLVTKGELISCFVRMESLRRARNVRPKGVRIMDVMRGQKGSLPTEILLDSAMVKVADIMREQPITVKVDDPISRAITLMQENEIRYIPVIDKHELVGLISDYDIASNLPPPEPEMIARRGEEKKFLDNLFLVDTQDKACAAALTYKISSAMTEDPIAEGSETRWLEVAELLYNSGSGDIGAVPVIDDNTERVCGMVTEREILGIVQTLGKMMGSANR